MRRVLRVEDDERGIFGRFTLWTPVVRQSADAEHRSPGAPDLSIVIMMRLHAAGCDLTGWTGELQLLPLGADWRTPPPSFSPASACSRGR